MKRMKTMYLFTFTLLSSLSFHVQCQQVQATISYGELVDKITILTIKTERITDPEKLHNIVTELEFLLNIFNQYIGDRTDVTKLMRELKETNEKLWDIEDLIRAKERIKDFGGEFVQLARNVYITNDHRCLIKRKIDTLLGSQILEEKSYDAYA